MEETTKILIIEDNPDVLEVIKNILEYCGYSAIGYTKFNERIFEQLKTENLGLIILDVMLSGSDGRDVARRFKGCSETENVPILMISAYPNVSNSVREAGATDFLQKPFSMDDLTQKVEQFLDSNHE